MNRVARILSAVLILALAQVASACDVFVTSYLSAGQPDGSTDNTSQIQDAYNAVARLGGGTVCWPKNTYKVAGTVYFAGRVNTDFQGSTVYGSGFGTNTMFETGYLNNATPAVLITNFGTGDNDQTSQVLWTTFNNGVLRDAGLVFHLFKFEMGSGIHRIEFRDVSQAIDATWSFHSDYTYLTYFESIDHTPNHDDSVGAATTSGSNLIGVPNARAAALTIGMQIGAMWIPYGTTITAKGAADSYSAGFTRITLSANATATSAYNGASAGFFASSFLTPLYNFHTAMSANYFYRVVANSRMIGWQLEDVSSAVFVACDVGYMGYGFRLKGSSRGNTWINTFVENLYGWAWDFSEMNGSDGGDTSIGLANYGRVAGILTAGTSGHLSGTIQLPPTVTGFTPYAFSGQGHPYLDLTSSNAKVTVLGGWNDARNGTGDPTIVNEFGFSPRSVSSGSVPNRFMFIDSSDNKLKFRDSSGTLHDLY